MIHLDKIFKDVVMWRETGPEQELSKKKTKMFTLEIIDRRNPKRKSFVPQKHYFLTDKDSLNTLI